MILPADTGDKLSYGLTVLLGFVFAQSIIAGFIPVAFEPTILAQYIMQAVVLCAINLAGCTILTFLFNRPEEDQPHLFIKVIVILVLGTIVCRPCCMKKKVKPVDDPAEKKTDKNNESEKNKADEKIKVETVKENQKGSEKPAEKDKDKEKEKDASGKTEEKKEEEKEYKENWKEVAYIFNIYFSIIYGIIFLIILLVYLYRMLT